MNSLVTGGNGYIGSHLIQELTRKPGHTVFAYVNQNSDVIDSLNIPEVVKIGKEELPDAIEQSETIYHVATNFQKTSDIESVSEMVNANVLFGAMLLSLAQLRGFNDPKFVGVSTFSSFDQAGNYNPANPYSATKYAFEALARAFDVDTRFVRFSDTYGPDDVRPKVHNLLFKKLSEGEPFEFQITPEQRMRILHVQDAVRGLIHASEIETEERHSTFDLYGPEITLGEIARQAQARYDEADISWAEGATPKPLQDSQTIRPLPDFKLEHDPNLDLAETVLGELPND